MKKAFFTVSFLTILLLLSNKESVWAASLGSSKAGSASSSIKNAAAKVLTPATSVQNSSKDKDSTAKTQKDSEASSGVTVVTSDDTEKKIKEIETLLTNRIWVLSDIGGKIEIALNQLASHDIDVTSSRNSLNDAVKNITNAQNLIETLKDAIRNYDSNTQISSAISPKSKTATTVTAKSDPNEILAKIEVEMLSARTNFLKSLTDFKSN